MRVILLFELRRMLRGRTALALALALGTLLAMCAMLCAPYAAQSGLALPGAMALVYHSVLSQFGFIVLGTIYCYAFARDFDGTWRFYAQAGVSPRHAVLARLALLSLFSAIAAAAMYPLLSLAFGSAGNASAFAVVSVALSVLFCCALSCSASLVARSPPHRDARGPRPLHREQLPQHEPRGRLLSGRPQRRLCCYHERTGRNG